MSSEVINIEIYEQPILQLEWYVGVPGEAAIADNTLQVIAGQDLSSGRAVYLTDEEVYYFDPTQRSTFGRTLGITTTAANQGTLVNVQLQGRVTVAGWGLIPNAAYFATYNGVLSTTHADKVVQQLGFAINSNQLIIHFQTPIILWQASI